MGEVSSPGSTPTPPSSDPIPPSAPPLPPLNTQMLDGFLDDVILQEHLGKLDPEASMSMLAYLKTVSEAISNFKEAIQEARRVDFETIMNQFHALFLDAARFKQATEIEVTMGNSTFQIQGQGQDLYKDPAALLEILSVLLAVLSGRSDQIVAESEENRAVETGEGETDKGVEIDNASDAEERENVGEPGSSSRAMTTATQTGETDQMMLTLSTALLNEMLVGLSLFLDPVAAALLQQQVDVITAAISAGAAGVSVGLLAANSTSIPPTRGAVELAGVVGVLVSIQQISASDMPETAARNIAIAALGSEATEQMLEAYAELFTVVLQLQLALMALLTISSYGSVPIDPETGTEDEAVASGLQQAVMELATALLTPPSGGDGDENQTSAANIERLIHNIIQQAVGQLPPGERENLRQALEQALINVFFGGEQIPVVDVRASPLFFEFNVNKPTDADLRADQRRADTTQPDSGDDTASLAPSIDDIHRADQSTTAPPLFDLLLAHFERLNVDPAAEHAERVAQMFEQLLGEFTNPDEINRMLLDPANQLWLQGFSLYYGETQFDGGSGGHRGTPQV